ncbi:DNA-directed RNA polymerase III subunit RPC9-like [Lineus longissimus]|uniref:DNA-directed RNA polymerase III subunit RPC9-like n=1 Tax=Lineus longissimus TaxID=88925 RepID=UPI002B4E65F1
MEVINENAALLSNYEVLHLLTDLQAGENGQKKPNKYLQNLATISYETTKYLEKTPCKDQSPEIIEKFMNSLLRYNLTKAEKLQLLNHRPTAAVEIQLLIEESEERLTEEQIEELLQLVAECLIPESTENDEEDEDEEMTEDT